MSTVAGHLAVTPLACHECPTPELTPGDGWDCRDGIRTHCNHECMVSCRDCWEWMQ